MVINIENYQVVQACNMTDKVLESKLEKVKERVFQQVAYLQKDANNLRFQAIISTIQITSLVDLSSALTNTFSPNLSKFDVKHSINTLIRILRQEGFEEVKMDQYLTLKSEMSKLELLEVPDLK